MNKLIFLVVLLVGCGFGKKDTLITPVPETPVPETPVPEQKELNIKISWIDNSDNEDEFLIERKIHDEYDFDVVYFVGENVNEYVDIDIDNQFDYCYRVGASNVYGVAYSETICTND